MGKVNSMKKRLILAMVFLVLGLVLPRLLMREAYSIITCIRDVISEEDVAMLLIVSFRLIAINTIRIIPIYFGSFVLTDIISQNPKLKKSKETFSIILPMIIILSFYFLVEVLFAIDYHFGIPAISTLVSIIILRKTTEKVPRHFFKLIVIGLFLFGVQWLDLAPALSDYGFGKGELSTDIKIVGNFLEVDYLLNWVALLLSSILVGASLLIAYLIILHNKQIGILDDNRIKDLQIARLRQKAIQSRALLELRSLAHDLKTPLTAIQGLAGVLSMQSRGTKQKEYADMINQKSDQLSGMISEMLHKEKKSLWNAQDIISQISSHMMPHPGREKIKVTNEISNVWLKINKTRMSRAVINIIQNAQKAIEGQKNGYIDLFTDVNEDRFKIVIVDNGRGISPGNLEKIWDLGYTSQNDKGSTGVGLSFCKEVVSDHGGEIEISSVEGEGTKVVIRLPFEEKGNFDDKKDN